MRFKNIFTYILIACISLSLIGETGCAIVSASDLENWGDVVENPWDTTPGSISPIPDLSMDDKEKPTEAEDPTEDTGKENIKLKTFRKAGRVKVKTAKKKKSSAKVKITLKKAVKAADGYKVWFYKTKKNAKKNKKVLAKITYKKNKKTFTVKNKKLKNKKTLYVCVKAYVKINDKTYYSKKRSVVKRVKITKK